MQSYDPQQAARRAREAHAAYTTNPPPPPPPLAVRDPLPYCVYTTVALLAWLFSPPVAVAAFAALALHKYWRAYRAGLQSSQCLLGDPRRVMAYLGLLFLAGFGWTIYRLVALLGLG